MMRDDILHNLRVKISSGSPITAMSCGTGLTAKCAKSAGVDMIFLNHAGYFRMAGRSTFLSRFSFGSANQITRDRLIESLPLLYDTPVFVGVFAEDPFTDLCELLSYYKSQGVVGIQNCPSFGMISDATNSNMEAGLMGYSLEHELVKTAKEMGFIVASMVYAPNQVKAFVEAESDIIIANCGITVGPFEPAEAPSFDNCVGRLRAICQSVKGEGSDALILAHGGALTSADAVQRVYDEISEVDGFYGGSALERIPIEETIKATIKRFKEAGQ